MFGLFRKGKKKIRGRKDVVTESASIQEEFGNFYYKQEYEWFEGKVDWVGNEGDILLDQDADGETASEALQTLRLLMSDTKMWDCRLRDFAAKDLTDSANDWKTEDEPEITEENFAKRIGYPSLHMDSEGGFEAVYNDDGMFYGHWIVVRGNRKGELLDAYIEG